MYIFDIIRHHSLLFLWRTVIATKVWLRATARRPNSLAHFRKARATLQTLSPSVDYLSPFCMSLSV